MNLIIFLLIGALAGWLAGIVMKGRGFGLLINMVVGVLGAFFGGWLLPKFGVSIGGEFGGFLTAFIGAVILLALIGLVKKA
ncbi:MULTISPECIES: GlsB/YeaQ/YmgE family stress response membrane protein [unclassified Arenimonas]|uniref:GlsB/YeaQ/YmgE family stress response membrane protein n=1 Tax=unclassified Arenimonas TaxID=2641713 RepID=UPI00086E740F|nr:MULTISPECIES: GlsB/YeaQ/YmgE family stress response membrane protein [unclassified Arenimonas]ODS64283.1 MAG: transglycosylase [Arenimonas sp. SCN 70-307]